MQDKRSANLLTGYDKANDKTTIEATLPFLIKFVEDSDVRLGSERRCRMLASSSGLVVDHLPKCLCTAIPRPATSID